MGGASRVVGDAPERSALHLQGQGAGHAGAAPGLPPRGVDRPHGDAAMTTLDERHGPAAPDDGHPVTEALIEEARRLRRRRYLFVGVVLSLVTVGTTSVLWWAKEADPGARAGATPRRRRHHPSSRPPRARGDRGCAPGVGALHPDSVTSKGLLLTGETPATAEHPEPTCVAAPVDRQSLAIGKVKEGSCGDPALFGRTSKR